jgi:hypothetical protein
MKNEVAAFMIREIDAKLATRKRKIDPVLEHKLNKVREVVDAGADLSGIEEEILNLNYARFTDPNRLKWGHAVRLS